MIIYHAYISKQNSNHESEIIDFIVSNGLGQHYLAVEKWSALLRRITSKHDGGF